MHAALAATLAAAAHAAVLVATLAATRACTALATTTLAAALVVPALAAAFVSLGPGQNEIVRIFRVQRSSIGSTGASNFKQEKNHKIVNRLQNMCNYCTTIHHCNNKGYCNDVSAKPCSSQMPVDILYHQRFDLI
jgi:hypothetical protein